MSERRFNDQEVAEILERATQVSSSSVTRAPNTDGMTLAQLQEIGREVGIPPEAMEVAARSIDLAGRHTSRQFLGLPIGVGLTANLGRKLSDEEWQRLVVDLRETFDARGRVHDEGAFRQWTNGNLQILIEPATDGSQIRMRTLNQNAQLYVGMGLGLVALVIVAFGAKLLAGGDAAHILQRFLPVALIGAGLTAFGAVPLRTWARTRRAQMESVVARLRAPR
jgi:hypothetical protein